MVSFLLEAEGTTRDNSWNGDPFYESHDPLPFFVLKYIESYGESLIGQQFSGGLL